MFSSIPSKIRFAKTMLQETETPVLSHLAFSLGDLDKLHRAGKPISVSNAESYYYDGDNNSSMVIPLDRRRGCDINDFWNDDKKISENLSKLKVKNLQHLSSV